MDRMLVDKEVVDSLQISSHRAVYTKRDPGETRRAGLECRMNVTFTEIHDRDLIMSHGQFLKSGIWVEIVRDQRLSLIHI